MEHIEASGNKPRVIVRGWTSASKKTKKSSVQLWRDVRAGTFPAPFQLGPNAVAWFEDEIDDWLASRPRRNYSAAA